VADTEHQHISYCPPVTSFDDLNVRFQQKQPLV